MTAAEHRAQYHERKAARRCVYCNAGLQPADGVACVECHERQRLARDRWHAKHPSKGREYARNYASAKYKADPAAGARKAREWRETRKALGLCPECSDVVAETSNYCAFHHEVHRVRTLNHWRKKHGHELLPVPTRPRREPKFMRMKGARRTKPAIVKPPSTRDLVLASLGWLTPKPPRQIFAEVREQSPPELRLVDRVLARHLSNLRSEGLIERVAETADSNDVGYVLAKSARRAA